jgi:hypothetical protein
MDIEKELLTAEETEQARIQVQKDQFPSVLRNGVLTPANRDIIERGVRYYIYLLSLKTNRRDLHDKRIDVLRLIQQTGGLQANAVLQRQFREEVLKQVVEKSKALLDGHFHVRLNATMLIAELNIVEGDPNRQIPPEAYAPAADVLVEIVETETQPRAVKLAAINGLNRIALNATLSANLNLRIATVLIKELANKETAWWYQMRLVETLGSIDLTLDPVQRKPFIVQALVDVITDKGRHWIVRSEAAKACGRAKLDPQVKVNVLVYEIVRLTREMVDGRTQNPAAFYWRQCFFATYLAFQPVDAQERTRQVGLLQRAQNPSFRASQPIVTSAYQEIVPLVQQVLNAAAITPEQVQKLDAWLQQNRPDNLQVAQ